MTGGIPFWGTLAAVALLLVLHWVAAQAAARSQRLSRLLEGRAVALTSAGEPDHDALVRHGISRSDLEEAVRGSGVDSISGARLLMLEPSGKITVLKGGPGSC